MNSDFIIIGAGVTGLSSALALLRRGATVTILERGASGRESSWAGGGILSPLCPWDYPDEVTRLTSRGALLFSAWAQAIFSATNIDPEYEVSGMLVLPPFDAQLAKQWCFTHDVRVEENFPFSLSVTYPFSLELTEDKNERNSIFLPDVAQVRNPRLMRALRNQVEMLGGKIVEQCEVLDMVVSGERVRTLTTPCGVWSAENFIVAAGAWSNLVLGQHALQLDIKPIRGQMLLYKFNTRPLHHIIFSNGLYLIPRRDGYLLVGSTLENVGYDKECTHTAHDSLKLRAEALLPQLRNMVPVQHWAGLRPGSPHNIPTIGRHPQLENLYLNSGHFRYGVTMSTVSVEILMNEIFNEPQPFDVSPYHAGWNLYA